MIDDYFNETTHNIIQQTNKSTNIEKKIDVEKSKNNNILLL